MNYLMINFGDLKVFVESSSPAKFYWDMIDILVKVYNKMIWYLYMCVCVYKWLL